MWLMENRCSRRGQRDIYIYIYTKRQQAFYFLFVLLLPVPKRNCRLCYQIPGKLSIHNSFPFQQVGFNHGADSYSGRNCFWQCRIRGTELSACDFLVTATIMKSYLRYNYYSAWPTIFPCLLLGGDCLGKLCRNSRRKWKCKPHVGQAINLILIMKILSGHCPSISGVSIQHLHGIQTKSIPNGSTPTG